MAASMLRGRRAARDVRFMVDKSPAWHADEKVDRMFRRKMHNFVDHVLYDEPTLAPGRDGLAVQRMIDAMYRSAENGGTDVTIAP